MLSFGQRFEVSLQGGTEGSSSSPNRIAGTSFETSGSVSLFYYRVPGSFFSVSTVCSWVVQLDTSTFK